MDVIVHGLDAAGVSVRAVERVAKKSRRHMLHGVQAEAIAAGDVKRPHGRANQVGIDVLRDGISVGAVEGMPRTANRRTVGVHVILGVARLPNEDRFERGAAQGRPEIAVRRSRLVGDVDQSLQRFILHIPLNAVILYHRPVPEISAGRLQMKIGGEQSRVKIRRRGRVEPGCVEAAMIRDVVEIDADSETMRRLYHLHELGAGSPTRRDGAALVLVTEIKRVEYVVTRRRCAPGLGRRRQPQAVVAGLGDFRHFIDQVGPIDIEQLKHRLAVRGEVRADD